MERHLDPGRRTIPANPKLVWHIPNENNASSRSVSVVYDYTFDGSGRDYLIRNSEFGDVFKFQIFDITSRGTDPKQISLVSEITATPEDSCGRGCGGTLIGRAHKGWWSQETGYFYSAAGEPGFRTTIAQIWDLKNPKQPKFVGRMWIPGQKDGEPGDEGQYAHHPNVDEQNQRIYIGYREAGWTAAFDISNPAQPKLVWSLDLNPPHRGPHTVVADRLRPGPEFRRRRAAAEVRLGRGRGRRSGRSRAMPRHPLEELHARHHERGAPPTGQHLAGAGRRSSAIRADASAPTSRRKRSMAG